MSHLFKYKGKYMEKLRIEISSKHKKKLMTEFEVSLQTIQYALDFTYNSERSKKIRERAKELLQVELDKIENITID